MARKVRCLSCRKLKIACDEARPKCEYCAATHRECIYPNPTRGVAPESSSEPSSESSLISLNHLQYDTLVNSAVLNKMYVQLGISKFEYRLLTEFDSQFVRNNIKPGMKRNPSPLDKLWMNEVPHLWGQSSLLRSNMYSISSMFLADKVSLSQMLVEDLGPQVEYKQLGGLENKVQQMVLEFFGNSLVQTMAATDEVCRSPHGLTSVRAAELVFSAIILFTFLSLQSYDLMPLLDLAGADVAGVDVASAPVDLVRLVSSMKLAIGECLPALVGSPYTGLFYVTEIFSPTQLDEIYPIVEHLKTELYRYKSSYTGSQFEDLQWALEMFERCMASAVQNDDRVPFLRLIFLWRPSVYKLMLEYDFFSVQMLFYYSTLTLLVGLKRSPTNIFQKFNDQFRSLSFRMFGGWQSQTDMALYQLSSNGVDISSNLQMLQNFVPETYEYHG